MEPSENRILVPVLRLPQLAKVLGVSESTIRRLPNFPAPIQLGCRAIGWRTDQVAEWVDSRPTI
jgi:prophage regulatory protein